MDRLEIIYMDVQRLLLKGLLTRPESCNRQTLLLPAPSATQRALANVPDGLQLRQTAQNPRRIHTLSVDLSAMAERAPPVYHQSTPQHYETRRLERLHGTQYSRRRNNVVLFHFVHNI